MAEFKLSYTANQIDERLKKIDNLAEKSELPKKTSDLVNDSDFATQNYVKNSLGNYALKSEIPVVDLSDYALKNEIPTNYLTEIPAEYVTESELNAKGYLTEHQSLAGYALKTEIPSIDGLASETYVEEKVAALVNSAPETLNTLDELAAALGDDANFAATVTTELGKKANTSELGALATKDTVTKNDLDSSVQSSLDKADSALQSYTETDPTVPAWAKAATKPTYTADEVGALPADTVIPTVPTNVSAFNNDAGYLTEHQSLAGLASETYVNTKIGEINIPDALSDLTTDSTHRVVTDAEKAAWNAKSNFSGDYNDLSNKPTIPSISGLATESYVNTKISEIPTPDVSGQINTHNTATDSHNDIRLLVEGLTTRLNTLANSDDTTLDQMSEIVAYIKSNKSLIEGVTNNKVNVADIVDNLTTNVSNKPLSAAQGVALKALIDAIVVPTKVSELTNDSGFLSSIPSEYVTETELNAKGYLTSYTETDPTVPSWAKQSTKPSYTKSEIGLGNVDNTSDTNKPVSTAQATAIADAKKAGTDAQSNLTTHTNNKSNPHGVTKAQVGLGNVDNARQYSASNPPVVAQATAPSDTSVIWVDTDDNSVGDFQDAVNIALAQAKASGEFTPIKGVDYFTNADQESIVQQVITALGTPVFGRVDAENNIILTGELVDGTYTVKYEDAEGNVTEIGTLKQGESYRNLADPTSADWLTNKRINSSGSLVDVTEAQRGDDTVVITNYIDMSGVSKLYIKGLDVMSTLSSGQNYGRFYQYTSAKVLQIGSAQPSKLPSGNIWVTKSDYDESVWVVDLVGLNGEWGYIDERYCRWGGILTGTAEDVIITADQKIV